MRFGSVTPEFKTYEVVRLAPIVLPQLFQMRLLGSTAAISNLVCLRSIR